MRTYLASSTAATDALRGLANAAHPEAPLDMPVQPVSADRTSPPVERDGRWRLPLILVCAVALTGLMAFEMFEAFEASGGVSPLEWAALIVFALNFAWIAAAGGTAFAGFAVLMTQRRAKSQAPATSSTSRTAIVVPVYNEDAAHVMGGASAVWDDLKASGLAQGFEMFFLSDTTDPDRALAEEAVFRELKRSRPGDPLFYRRRTINKHRKSGNIADFVQRWGGRYDYMVVFDADSLMTSESLAELVRRMDQRPRTALIQTLPVIVNAQTLFSRAQQFAMRAYGPLFGAGLAWWSGGAGNFWGHNAIIRVKAFAAHAGLPDLPGKAPLGGPILSHDFVEAALLRRAGWRVEIAPDIAGSYEESPPTLVDAAIRDRRWAQGNLQHLGVIGARGLDWLSRAHIFAGVMGYVSSLLWFALVLLGIALAFETTLRPVDYFPERAMLPAWPVVDVERGLRLFAITAVLVLSPKLLSIIAWSVGALPGWAWRPKFVISVAVEAVLSALVAPVMMLSQASAVIGTLMGADAGWRPQVRSRDGFSLAALTRVYLPHMLVGAGLLAIGAVALPGMGGLVALVPACLLLAVPISGVMSRRLPQSGLLRWILATPEEDAVPAIVSAAAEVVGKACARASVLVRGHRPGCIRRRKRPDGRYALGAGRCGSPHAYRLCASAPGQAG